MEDVRFACDAMLGTLARWLRFAGLDTVFLPDAPDPLVAALAREEGRWLLTRDRRLAARAGPRVVLLRSGSLAGQVAELRARVPLAADRTRFFTRCSVCNGPLEEIRREEAAQRVPPYVAVHAVRFLRCSGCARIYWPGTHPERIARRLESLFGG